MKKFIIALLASCAGTCAFAQTRGTIDSILAEKKPHPLSLQLLRASELCGPAASCADEDLRRAAHPAATDPCLSDPFGCHLATSSYRDHGRSWYIGGAKLNTEVGRMTFSIGRHRDNIVLTRAPFVEGSYRFGTTASLAAGVLRARTGVLPHNTTLLYVSFRMELR